MTSNDDVAWEESEAVQEKGVRARAGRERKHRTRGQSISLTPIKFEMAS
jgi:hypothetical protein